ncbi:MAG: hypothetical protein WA908_10855 [Pontixanthobacter sp.]
MQRSFMLLAATLAFGLAGCSDREQSDDTDTRADPIVLPTLY